MITRAELEQKLPIAFLKVQECMAKILKDNKVVDDQQFAEHHKKVLTVLSDSILKIQQKCTSISDQTLQTPQLLSGIKASLSNSLGSKMESEINKIVDNFDNMISSFENHFTELKDKLQSLEDKFVSNENYLKTLNSQL